MIRLHGPRPALVLATALALLATLGAWSLQGAPRVARRAVVSASQRGVVARAAATAAPSEAAPGARLREGTDVRAAHGAAGLTLFDGSTLDLAAAAEAQLAVLRSGPMGVPCEVAIEQRHGHITYRAAPQCGGRSYFRVHVPGARLAGREAHFAVYVDADGNSRVQVYEGRVQVVGAGGSQLIAQVGDTVRVVEGIVYLSLVPRPPTARGGAYGRPLARSPTRVAPPSPIPR